MGPKTEGILESALYVSDVALGGFLGFCAYADWGVAVQRRCVLLGEFSTMGWGDLSGGRIGGLGIMAERKRGRGGRETEVGFGRVEYLFSRSGPALGEPGLGVLKRGGARAETERVGGASFMQQACPGAAGGDMWRTFGLRLSQVAAIGLLMAITAGAQQERAGVAGAGGSCAAANF